MIEISNELLSEVMEVEVTLIRDGICDSNLRFETSDKALRKKFSPYVPRINIYELAHKCKEWALSKGYYLRAEQGINYYDNLQWTCFLNTNMDDGADYVDYWNSTEVEAIIKACEWIYKEINK